MTEHGNLHKKFMNKKFLNLNIGEFFLSCYAFYIYLLIDKFEITFYGFRVSLLFSVFF